MDDPTVEHEDASAVDESLEDSIGVAEVVRFFEALRLHGPGTSVVVRDQESRTEWRKTFKQAVKAGALKYVPMVLLDESVPAGAIQVVEADDRGDELEEAVEATETVTDGGLIIPAHAGTSQ